MKTRYRSPRLLSPVEANLQLTVRRFFGSPHQVHVESRLRRIGVLRALAEQGFTAGDEVEIAGVVFELDPE